jgi:DnaK suppressor protein
VGDSPRDARDGLLPAGQGENTMTRKDSIEKMRELLMTRRNALRKALAGDLSLLKQLREQTGGDVVDEALDAAQDEISSQLAEVESRELANIERALVRMRNGSYGECEICGGRIPLARLNALPYATSCIECQRAAETSGGAGGGGGDWSRVLDAGYTDVDVSFSDLEAQ